MKCRRAWIPTSCRPHMDRDFLPSNHETPAKSSVRSSLGIPRRSPGQEELIHYPRIKSEPRPTFRGPPKLDLKAVRPELSPSTSTPHDARYTLGLTNKERQDKGQKGLNSISRALVVDKARWDNNENKTPGYLNPTSTGTYIKAFSNRDFSSVRVLEVCLPFPSPASLLSPSSTPNI